MTIRRLLAACTAAVICQGAAAQSPVAPPELRLLTEEYPPFNMVVQGKLTGVSTGIVRALMARQRINYTMEVVPWQRAITTARDVPNACVFSMSRTPERENNYQWIGPLVENEWVLFAREGEVRKPKDLEDARGMRIGSYAGDAIVHYLRERGHQVDVAPADANNPRKLMAGRIDYWATGKLIGFYILQQEAPSDIVPVLSFNKTRMYLACHRSLDSKLVEQLNAQLGQLARDGSIERIYQSFGYKY